MNHFDPGAPTTNLQKVRETLNYARGMQLAKVNWEAQRTVDSCKGQKGRVETHRLKEI